MASNDPSHMDYAYVYLNGGLYAVRILNYTVHEAPRFRSFYNDPGIRTTYEDQSITLDGVLETRLEHVHLVSGKPPSLEGLIREQEVLQRRLVEIDALMENPPASEPEKEDESRDLQGVRLP